MTREPTIELSRRSLLGGLGGIGVASAGAALGTSAYFTDDEAFEGNSIAAGSLDLKVDWEEHYYDGSSGRDLVSYSDPGGGAVGFPDPDDPQVWIAEDDVAAFMNATAVEAFPDPDDDGSQETSTDSFEYVPCEMGADVPADLDPAGFRTDNDDTRAGDGPAPLIDLQDVKPGDFGELTLSFHLCDNPGYVWLRAANVESAENGQTEPEAAVDQSSGGELADHVQTVWWYDSRGDNVLQTGCDETLYLIDSVGGTGTASELFEVDLTGGNAELTSIYVAGGGNFDQTDAIAATPDGDEVVFYDKESTHLGTYDVAANSFTDDGPVSGDPGGVVLAGYSPSGALWAASTNTDELYTVDRSGPSVTARGDTGIDLEGADLVFASDGTMYIWTAASADQGLYRVSDPANDATAVPVDASNVGGLDVRITGLAIRNGGTGNLVASDRDNDEIVVVERTDGTIQDRYPMTLGGEAYEYDYGDMSAGRYCGEVFRRGTLRADLDALASGTGIPLDGNRATPFDELSEDPGSPDRECFTPELTHYVGFAWWLPPDVGNVVQSDSIGFDLGFYAEQCRHNDGSGAPADGGT
ncbi:von Willebrand factor type A [Salinarchaeum sp. Harcht-Bsk1]|uniref:SipW-dependent-type signal peptide-containing protein n=1 Tax=Salinarchaeum sp. Harcht-Bsk1 TaxID=1333523 RepID=UPI0003424182|nr:SipW-dependent-type signal peptide-containing protein [Salinarchaeum sp. Harcht-Bsk1]AGN02239.1 von Willebrand factor type A [Salinarchaeum sp. Harcht-Bsk1]